VSCVYAVFFDVQERYQRKCLAARLCLRPGDPNVEFDRRWQEEQVCVVCFSEGAGDCHWRCSILQVQRHNVLGEVQRRNLIDLVDDFETALRVQAYGDRLD
jgi:hypothetical protein